MGAADELMFAQQETPVGISNLIRDVFVIFHQGRISGYQAIGTVFAYSYGRIRFVWHKDGPILIEDLKRAFKIVLSYQKQIVVAVVRQLSNLYLKQVNFVYFNCHDFVLVAWVMFISSTFLLVFPFKSTHASHSSSIDQIQLSSQFESDISQVSVPESAESVQCSQVFFSTL